MKKIIKFLLSLNLVLMLNQYRSIVSAQDLFPAVALAYDGESFDLIDIHATKDLNYIFKIILFACPAQTKQPNDVGRHETEFSLIIEQIHNTNDVLFVKLDDKICKQECKPNIKLDSIESSYMIGYKFYINTVQIETISKAIDKKFEDLSAETKLDINDGRLTKTHENSYWFVLMNIDTLPNRFKISEHVVETGNYNGDFKTCKNFNLGLSFVENNKDLERAYEKENQVPMLNKFMIPTLIEGKTYERYLIKQQLTPINDFDTNFKRLSTCSLLNTAPMWQTIADGAWKRVENFIKSIEDYGKIEVTTGTYRILEVTESEPPYDKKKVFLLNDTPVPELFWKWVKNRVPTEDQSVSYQGILIFTYNYISGTELHKPLCSDNVCQTLGWEVENDVYKTGFTYCCSVKKAIVTKLGIGDMSPFTDFELRKESKEMVTFNEDDGDVDSMEISGESHAEEILPVA